MPTPSRHPRATPRKPQGKVTRGKTASNRLRQVDHFVMRYDPILLNRQDGPFAGALVVDLGYGAEATTTLEMSERFWRINPRLSVLGVEIDQARVDAALPYASEQVFFRLGGFNLPLQDGESVRMIRAFNVLRQYEEAQVRPAWEQMAAYVLPGGLLIEGTSSPSGRIWAANVLRKDSAGLRQEALVFFTNFHQGFDPGDFQAILPKNYIHSVLPGEAIGDFFAAWKGAAAEMSAARAWGLRQWYAAAARQLQEKDYDINLQQDWLNKGWMIWRNPPE